MVISGIWMPMTIWQNLLQSEAQQVLIQPIDSYLPGMAVTPVEAGSDA